MNKPFSAVILGGAKNVFDDYARATEMHDFDLVIGINNIVSEVPEINHAVTMHPDKMAKWLEDRQANGFPPIPKLWTARERTIPEGHNYEILKNTRGGSGLLAIFVARYLNCQKIVLCGIPMERLEEHYHTAGQWKECKLYRRIWEANESLKRNDDIRSLSGGWTQEQYGQPSLDWFG